MTEASNGDPIVDVERVRQAADYLKRSVRRTPVLDGSTLAVSYPAGQLQIKAESLQITGSFKVRGALNRMRSLSAAERDRGVVTLSAGNHAIAVAHAAAELRTRAVVVMPAGASQVKVAATRALGAEVVLTEGSLLDACERERVDRDLVLVHPFDDLDVIAGQATVGLEIAEDADIDVVVVPVGGGGLIAGVSGVAKLLDPRVRVFGVEPVAANAMTRSLERGVPTGPDPGGRTIADGLAAPFAGVHTLRAVQRYVDEVVLVQETEIAAALRDIQSLMGLAVEPAAAAAVAGLRQLPIRADDRVMVVLSGRNVDPILVSRLMSADEGSPGTRVAAGDAAG